MALPLMLAGPILRRVDPTLVAVWVALSSDAKVTLKVWEGQLTARQAKDTASPFAASIAEQTWRLGEKLHLGLVTARLPPESGKSFRPDTTYCYDVEIKVGDAPTQTLQSIGLLDDTEEGRMHVPLGYEPDLLPSFALPPSVLTDLRIVYGSCRRPAHRDPDAMVMIDDHIAVDRKYKDPRARPHQLFLGGDQIYADDVHPLHLLMLFGIAQELIGSREELEDDRLLPLEDVDVGPLIERDKNQSADPENPMAGYFAVPATETLLPADRAHFPQELRRGLTQRAAQFTSTDGANHLISIGEFAAMYLSVWSTSVWTEVIPDATRLPDPDDDELTMPLRWKDDLGEEERVGYPDPEHPVRIPAQLYVPGSFDPDTRTPEKKQRDAEKERDREVRQQHGYRDAVRIHGKFLIGLPRVRRVLANVPTYMVLDDHDVTDDFFLSPVWRTRVLGTNLGQTILRNAMLTYALFQDWGNDPRKYDSGNRAELLTRATELFPPQAPGGQDKASRPIRAAADRLDILFGHDLSNERNVAGRFDNVNPPITWHFSVDGPKHRVIALDNRTRRSYVGDLGPPGNVSPEALRDQIPPPPLPAGIEMLLVVAPLQVIGPPVIDELLAPNLYRLHDLSGLGRGTDLDPKSLTREAGDDRDGPRRDRGLGTRRGDLRAPVGPARRLPACRPAVRRRAQLLGDGDELLAQG